MSNLPKIIKIAKGDEFELVNREADPVVEQALEIVHLLPPEDPLRLDLLRICGKQLIGQLTYVAIITTEEEAKSEEVK